MPSMNLRVTSFCATPQIARRGVYVSLSPFTAAGAAVMLADDELVDDVPPASASVELRAAATTRAARSSSLTATAGAGGDTGVGSAAAAVECATPPLTDADAQMCATLASCLVGKGSVLGLQVGFSGRIGALAFWTSELIATLAQWHSLPG